MFVGAEKGDRRTGLGQPVGVDEPRVGKQFERPFDHGLRHAATPVRERPQGGQTGGARALGVEVFHDPGQHRGHDHCAGDPLGPNEVDPGVGLERRELEQATSGEGVREDRGDAGHVIWRDAHQGRLLLAGRAELDGTEDVGDQVALAKDRRLGVSRRAAGEQEHGHVLAVECPVVVGRQRRRQFGPEDGPIDGLDAVDPVEASGRTGLGDGQGGRHPTGKRAQFCVGQSVVEGDEGDPRPGGTEEHRREGLGGDVGEHQVPGVDRPESIGDGAGPLEEFGERQAAVAGADGHPVGEATGCHLQQHHEVHSGRVFGRGVWRFSRRPGGAWPP